MVSKYSVTMATVIHSLPLSLPLSKLSHFADLFLNYKNMIISKEQC